MNLRQLLLPATIALLLAAPPAARGQGTAICHATGDPNTPYQQIDVPAEATVDHLQHADDIVPAPAGGCPAQLVPDEPDPAPYYPLPTVTAAPDVVPEPSRRRPRRRRPRPQAQVAPSISSGNLSSTADVESETLPMTGSEVPPIALMGVGFLLAGAGLRLRLRPNA